MILAAGLGTRLKPLTNKTPKPLVLAGGIPLIFYNLALLKKYGITEVVINLHHLGGQIRKTLGTGKKFGFKFYYSDEKTILGTAGGIRKAKRYLQEEPFLVLNGDIINDAPLDQFIKSAKKNKSALATLLVKPCAQKNPLGQIYFNSNSSRILSIRNPPIKKKGTIKKYQVGIFTGIQFISPKFFTIKKDLTPGCVVKDVYIPWLNQNKTLGQYLYDGYWNDLGTFEELKKTGHLLKTQKISLSYQAILDEFSLLL